MRRRHCGPGTGEWRKDAREGKYAAWMSGFPAMVSNRQSVGSDGASDPRGAAVYHRKRLPETTRSCNG